MTVWQFVTDHKTKILGTATALVATALSMLALNMFDADPITGMDALLSERAQRWWSIGLSFLNVALGGGTVAAGSSNSTKTKIAEAQVEIAQAMQTAIKSTPQE